MNWSYMGVTSWPDQLSGAVLAVFIHVFMNCDNCAQTWGFVISVTPKPTNPWQCGRRTNKQCVFVTGKNQLNLCNGHIPCLLFTCTCQYSSTDVHVTNVFVVAHTHASKLVGAMVCRLCGYVHHIYHHIHSGLSMPHLKGRHFHLQEKWLKPPFVMCSHLFSFLNINWYWHIMGHITLKRSFMKVTVPKALIVKLIMHVPNFVNCGFNI